MNSPKVANRCSLRSTCLLSCELVWLDFTVNASRPHVMLALRNPLGSLQPRGTRRCIHEHPVIAQVHRPFRTPHL